MKLVLKAISVALLLAVSSNAMAASSKSLLRVGGVKASQERNEAKNRGHREEGRENHRSGYEKNEHGGSEANEGNESGGNGEAGEGSEGHDND